jgi:hypothetical protein
MDDTLGLLGYTTMVNSPKGVTDVEEHAWRREIHIVGAHSMHNEGQFVTPSLEALIVRYADSIQWRILDKADLLAGKRYPDV